jgi:hypothetical protein
VVVVISGSPPAAALKTWLVALPRVRPPVPPNTSPTASFMIAAASRL